MGFLFISFLEKQSHLAIKQADANQAALPAVLTLTLTEYRRVGWHGHILSNLRENDCTFLSQCRTSLSRKQWGHFDWEGTLFLLEVEGSLLLTKQNKTKNSELEDPMFLASSEFFHPNFQYPNPSQLYLSFEKLITQMAEIPTHLAG